MWFENIGKGLGKGEGGKIKVIGKMGGDDDRGEFLGGRKGEGEGLGFRVDV